MLKKDERDLPDSCFNKAADDEMIFVLKESDPSFRRTVQFWADHRVANGHNKRDDEKIASALRIVDNAKRVEG